MLIAHVVFTVKSVDRPKVLDRMRAHTAEVRSMPGCIAFLPLLDPAEDGQVVILHEWNDAADFARYSGSECFARLGRDLRPLMTAPPTSRRFDARLVDTVA